MKADLQLLDQTIAHLQKLRAELAPQPAPVSSLSNKVIAEHNPHNGDWSELTENYWVMEIQYRQEVRGRVHTSAYSWQSIDEALARMNETLQRFIQHECDALIETITLHPQVSLKK